MGIIIDQIHLNHRKLNKKRKPYKRPCYAKEACISERPIYGNLLFPVCPVLRDILIDKPLYDISKIETTNSPLLDSVNRVRYVLRKLIELKPDEETIVRCAHTKDLYNRNFLTEWLKPIENDLKMLSDKLKEIFPSTSQRLKRLINEFMYVVDSYTLYSRTTLFLQFPLYLFGKDDYGFSVWRSQLTSSKPYGIVDEGGSNKEPDALVYPSKGAFACTYPIDAIEASRPICEELEKVAKHLDKEKIVSSKGVVNTQPQEKGEQDNISGMRWQDAKKKAETIVAEAGFKGFEKLRKSVGCGSKNTLRKAIDDSDMLTKAEADYKATSSTLKAVGLTENILATYGQTSEESSLSETGVNEILDELLKNVEEINPAKLEQTKTELKNMTPEGRQQLADTYNNTVLSKDGPETQHQYKEV